MVTDGIMESRNSSGEAFGKSKFHQILSETDSHDDSLAKLKGEFELFTGGQFEDDVSMISIRVC